jgi:hypothetical protein
MSYKDSPQKDGKILKQKEIKGMKAFGLKFYNTSKSYFIHKLVAEHFCSKPSVKHSYVIHIDHDKHNNKANNLKFATHAELLAHQAQNPNALSTAKRNVLNSGKNGKVLNEIKVVRLKKELYDSHRKLTLKELAKKYGISEMTLYRIKRGELWYAVRIEEEPKSKRYKLYKKIKKERKAIKKRNKHVAA